MQGFMEFNESVEHYNSGYSASKSGKSRQDNPYKEGSLAAKYWAKGYEHHKTGKQPEKFTEEKKITVKTKNGGEIPATIKVTGKDYHIVKTDSGKTYKVDHQGNSLEEDVEIEEAVASGPAHVYDSSNEKRHSTYDSYKKAVNAMKKLNTAEKTSKYEVRSAKLDESEKETEKDLPFTPDKKPTKPSTPGKYGSAYSTVRNLARKALEKQKQVKEEEQLDEKSAQARANKARKNVMDAGRGIAYRQKTGVNLQPKDTGHDSYQAMNKALGRQLRREELDQDLEENAPVAPSVGVHRIGVTVSDPGHTAVSKRNEKLQKFVKITAHSKENAVEQGKKFYAKKGFKVHDAEHAGMVHEEVEIEEGYRGNSEADKPFFAAQDHKKAAEKARKSGDHFSYHKHMSAHHDAMEQWNSNKGRTHVANQHAMKADEHEDYAQQARKGSK